MLIACFFIPLAQAQNWDFGSNWVETPTPSVSPAPIGLTEIIILIFFIFFTALALVWREPFLFALSAFISIVFAIDLVMMYIDNSASWLFAVVGLGLLAFGIFMLTASLTTGLKNKGRQK